MHEETNLLKLILESNILNFSVAFVVIVFVLGKALPESRDKRRQELEKEISAAKQARELAEQKLQELESEIEKTKQEAERIVRSAKETAESLRYQVMGEAKAEIDKMNLIAAKEIDMQRILAVESIKKEVASAALVETEKTLKAKRSEIDTLIKTKLSKDLAEIN